jgi:hypothetical protein
LEPDQLPSPLPAPAPSSQPLPVPTPLPFPAPTSAPAAIGGRRLSSAHGTEDDEKINRRRLASSLGEVTVTFEVVGSLAELGFGTAAAFEVRTRAKSAIGRSSFFSFPFSFLSFA